MAREYENLLKQKVLDIAKKKNSTTKKPWEEQGGNKDGSKGKIKIDKNKLTKSNKFNQSSFSSTLL